MTALRPAEARDVVGVFRAGLWRLRDEIALLTGLRPERRYLLARGLAGVVGWGHKPTAARARAIAARAALTYHAIEDGFLRSAAPGNAEPAFSYVHDPVGIYYDASGPSRLEALIHARAAAPERAAEDAAPALHAIRALGVSKYNLPVDPRALEALGDDPEGAVLVVDQTLGDASVSGAGASADCFERMLIAAAEERPNDRIVLRVHPETRMGRRPGYLDDAALRRASRLSPAFADARAAGRVVVFSAPAAPRDLVARARRVYATSSLLGLEALMLGARVTCFGRAFYSGWGLTDDRAPPTGRRGTAPLEAVVAAAYRDYSLYLSPETRRPTRIEEVVDRLVAARSG